MNNEYTAQDYAADIDFILTRLVGRRRGVQEELNARVLLQNVMDYEPIHGDVVPVLSTKPTYEDVRGI